MNTQTMSKYLLAMILALTASVILSLSVTVVADEPISDGPKIGVGGFLDEDGDGFNDLMPDTDGDGVPDALDPDYRNRQSDGTFMREQMNGMDDTTGVRHHDLPDDDRHPILRDGMGPHDGGGPIGPGEPGQYGPGDSTRHDGMGGDHRRGGHEGGDMGGDPDSSGMGGGGHRPIIDPRHGDGNNQDRNGIIRDNNTINSKGNTDKNIQPDGVRDGGK